MQPTFIHNPPVDEPYILGIDEAGRGPILGPMVYGAAWCPQSYASNLKKMGFADSKKLNPEKRKVLFNKMKADTSLCWKVDVISAEQICADMFAV